MSLPDYGVALGVAEGWAAFSLSRAAFAVACCRRSESAFSRSTSGVLCGFTVVWLWGLEQPAAANRLRTRRTKKKFFMTWMRLEWRMAMLARLLLLGRRLSNLKNKNAARNFRAAFK